MPKQSNVNYPLIDQPDNNLVTQSGRAVDDITREQIAAGDWTATDVQISPDNLVRQAEVADSVGRNTLADNFRRAAELTAVPEADILRIYNALRPRRSTKAELFALIEELESKWHAPLNAAMVREALAAYEARNCLRDK